VRFRSIIRFSRLIEHFELATFNSSGKHDFEAILNYEVKIDISCEILLNDTSSIGGEYGVTNHSTMHLIKKALDQSGAIKRKLAFFTENALEFASQSENTMTS